MSVRNAGGRFLLALVSGAVLGASDKIGAFPSADPVDPVDIHATMLHCLGLDARSEIQDHLGRPYPLSTGRVIPAILAS